MFQPPALYQDIVVTKVIFIIEKIFLPDICLAQVMELLVMATEILHLKDLQIQCQEVKDECQSTRYMFLKLEIIFCDSW